jgi:hypothetical protein
MTSTCFSPLLALFLTAEIAISPPPRQAVVLAVGYCLVAASGSRWAVVLWFFSCVDETLNRLVNYLWLW